MKKKTELQQHAMNNNMFHWLVFTVWINFHTAEAIDTDLGLILMRRWSVAARKTFKSNFSCELFDVWRSNMHLYSPLFKAVRVGSIIWYRRTQKASQSRFRIYNTVYTALLCVQKTWWNSQAKTKYDSSMLQYGRIDIAGSRLLLDVGATLYPGRIIYMACWYHYGNIHIFQGSNCFLYRTWIWDVSEGIASIVVIAINLQALGFHWPSVLHVGPRISPFIWDSIALVYHYCKASIILCTYFYIVWLSALYTKPEGCVY